MTSDETVNVESEFKTNRNNSEDAKSTCSATNSQSKNVQRRKKKSNNKKVGGASAVQEVLNDLVENSVTEAAVKTERCQNNKLTDIPNDVKVRDKKLLHRKTRVFVSDEEERRLSKRDSLYSLKEYDEEHDENEETDKRSKNKGKFVQTFNDKVLTRHKSEISLRDKRVKAKSSIFDGFFRRRVRKENGEEHYVQESRNKKHPRDLNVKTCQNKSLDNASIQNVNENKTGTTLTRTPSLRKKLTNFLNRDAPNLLKRSLSFKDLSKRRDKEKSREKLSELKTLEWASSLQSLVETDIGISYKDLSFINYDAQNEISYRNKKVQKDFPIRIMERTQSMRENSSSPTNKKSGLLRGTSFPRQYQSTIDLSDSGTVSLPSLHSLQIDGNLRQSFCRPSIYRKRPPSVCSDDGTKSRSIGNGSFKTAGNGCAKLKRHNACRQKNRDSATAPGTAKYPANDTVRSKSLNHLDEIEMKQSLEPASDSGLKDSKSEPDCTSRLLTLPARTIPTPEPYSLSSSVGDSAIEHPARKHVLTRSQKSSSECFSVNFEVGDESTWDNELFFPAIRGITLNDSLSKLCELRNLDLNSCDAWLQDKSNNTNAWLPFSQDTACLVAKHVRITPKDSASNKSYSSFYGSQSKKGTVNSRSRTSSFFSSSVEDAAPSLTLNTSQDNRLLPQDLDAAKKQPKQRWSGFFSNTKDTKMEQLVEQLNNYAKNGIPNCQIYPQGQCESIDALYKLEGDWREMIDFKELTEKSQQQQTALWELIKTEVAYIKTLKVVTDLFLACLKNLQSVNLLKEIDTEKLFSNITEILDANVLFWRNCIFPLVRDMRRYKQPPCIENMLQGFLKIGDTFQAYFRYCAEQARCQHYCRENHTHNELFTAYLAWCETQKECNRLRLMDILVQPMQRLTKYGLLLKAILRNTDDDVEKDNLNLMIKSVDDFVNDVNFSLKQKQDNERLKGIMARIESYDVVESKDDDLEKLLKAYNQLDLNKPMIGCPPERKRHLLLEGDLKLKDSSASKMEVHCFLLTDMLLVCKPSTKKGGATMRIVRQPYLVDRLVVTELNKETPSIAVIYKNEFDLPVAAFILQNNDAKKLKSWKESIAKAQLLYHQAKQIHFTAEDSVECDYTTDYNIEGDYHSLQLMPRSPLASSSRASRVSSLAHSHSGSVEMNDQSSVASANQSRAVSMENENRTASLSSDEGVQSLPPEKTTVSQKLSFKHRLFNKTPNTLSVQPYGNLGQSLPNLTLGSPGVNSLNLNLSQNTLSVPNTKTGGHLLSPTHRGVSYPPPSPTRGNLKRGLAISQNKNPPLLKTRHVTSTVGPTASGQPPTSFDFDVPVIAGISSVDDNCENFSRGQHRQAMLKRIRNDKKRYHTAGVVDDIKHNDNKDPAIRKRLSWNCSPQTSENYSEEPT